MFRYLRKIHLSNTYISLNNSQEKEVAYVLEFYQRNYQSNIFYMAKKYIG